MPWESGANGLVWTFTVLVSEKSACYSSEDCETSNKIRDNFINFAIEPAESIKSAFERLSDKFLMTLNQVEEAEFWSSLLKSEQKED